jgi:putative aldouronate transport system substrate-binding protein
MKRVICFVMAGFMLIVMFAACGTDNSSKSNSSSIAASSSVSTAASKTEASTSETQAQLKEAELTFYFPGEAKKDSRMVLDEAEKRIKDTLNVKLNFNFIPWGDYSSKINVLITAGDNYDAHFDASWFIYPTLAQKGALLDIGEMWKQYAPHLYSEFTEDELYYTKTDGKLFSIPWKYPKSNRITAIVREDLKEKYNVPDIKTIEDFEVYLEAVKKNENTILPYTQGIDSMLTTMYNIGGNCMLDAPMMLVYKWDDKDMKVMPFEQTPEYKQLIEMKTRWYKNGYMSKDMSGTTDAQVSLTDGKAAAIFGAWDGTPANQKKIKNTHPDWKLENYPMYPDKLAPLDGPLGNIMAFNANAKNPERALMFLEWMHKDQANYDLIMYGIEGVHYQLEGNLLKDPPDLKTENPYLSWSGEWALYDINLQRFSVDDPKDYKQNLIDFSKMNTAYYPHLGFTANPDSVKTEVAQRKAVYDEMGKQLEYGALSADKVDEYIKKQKDAGTDKIVTEVQKQLDAWRKNK